MKTFIPMCKVKLCFECYPKCFKSVIAIFLLFICCFQDQTLKFVLGDVLFEFSVLQHSISKLSQIFPCQRSSSDSIDPKFRNAYYMEDTEQIQLTTDSCLSIEVCLLPSTSWRYEEGISHCKYGVISELKLKTNFSSGFVNTNNISLLYKDVWSENLLLAIQLKSCCTLSGKTNTSKSDFVFFLSLDRITPSKQIRYGIMKRSLNTSLSVTVSENQVDELSIFYQALCDSHFYGNNCNVFCQEQKGLYGNYRCNEETGSRICQNGWSGDACTDAVCEFGCKHGRCTKPNYCHCDTGWYGNDCSQCRVYPGCLHGGCKVNKLDYTLIPFTCECDDGWGGMLCDKDLRYCTKNLNSCRNNGICVNTEAGNGIPYQCVCPPGFRGDHCETIEYDCRIHGCSGHGECIINNVGIASCYCQPSYYGNLCQFNQTTCDEFPCQAEGSVCEKLENIDLNLFSKDHHFKCICPPGYGGFNCEIDIDECASKPCKNGGLCRDLINGYQCVCPSGYGGYRCDKEGDECIMEQCPQGYQCLINNTESLCVPSISYNPTLSYSSESQRHLVITKEKIHSTYLKFSHFPSGLSAVIFIALTAFILMSLLILLKYVYKLSLVKRIPYYDSERDIEFNNVQNPTNKCNSFNFYQSKDSEKNCDLKNKLYIDYSIDTNVKTDYL